MPPNAPRPSTQHSERIESIYLQRTLYENYPPFQRGKVWSMTTKRLLIDTILRGGYIHPLLITQDEDEDGSMKYQIIDGQQRLSAMLEFREGGFTTISNALNRKEEPLSLPPLEPNRYFTELSPTAQNAFKNYLVHMYNLETPIDDPSIGLTYRRVQNQVPLSVAEKLFSYTSKAAKTADTLSKHPVWTKFYQGKQNRMQAYQGSLYPIYIELFQGYCNMSLPRLRELVAGAKDAAMTETFLQTINDRLDIVLHAFTGVPFGMKEEIIPMYQAILFLEKGGYTFKTSDKGCLTEWFAGLQTQFVTPRRLGFSSPLAKMAYAGMQREFWDTQMPLVANALEQRGDDAA